MIERFRTLTLGTLILVAFMLTVQLLLSAWRWKALVDYFGPVKVSTADLCWFIGASHFYGEVLPSTIGGDAVRAAMLARLTGLGPAALSVTLDRITGLAMLLVIMIVLLPLLWWRIEHGPAFVGLAGFSIGGLVALGALLLLRRETIPRWVPRAGGLIPEIATRLREALTNPVLRAQLIAYGLLVQLLSVALFFVLGRALGCCCRLSTACCWCPLRCCCRLCRFRCQVGACGKVRWWGGSPLLGRRLRTSSRYPFSMGSRPRRWGLYIQSCRCSAAEGDPVCMVDVPLHAEKVRTPSQRAVAVGAMIFSAAANTVMSSRFRICGRTAPQ